MKDLLAFISGSIAARMAVSEPVKRRRNAASSSSMGGRARMPNAADAQTAAVVEDMSGPAAQTKNKE